MKPPEETKPSECPDPSVHGNPFRYCPYCMWTETYTEQPVVHPEYQRALDDVAALFARNRDTWIETRTSHPEEWDARTQHAYAEGARVLAAWAEDPTRMTGVLRAIGRKL